MSDIEAGRRRLDISAHDVWVGYFAVGGNGSEAEVGRWLAGESEVPWRDLDMIAQALNDVFTERGVNNHPVAYTHE